jgi:hypothetical protein
VRGRHDPQSYAEQSKNQVEVDDRCETDDQTCAKVDCTPDGTGAAATRCIIIGEQVRGDSFGQRSAAKDGFGLCPY